jgi:hypothetical protein
MPTSSVGIVCLREQQFEMHRPLGRGSEFSRRMSGVSTPQRLTIVDGQSTIVNWMSRPEIG